MPVIDYATPLYAAALYYFRRHVFFSAYAITLFFRDDFSLPRYAAIHICQHIRRCFDWCRLSCFCRFSCHLLTRWCFLFSLFRCAALSIAFTPCCCFATVRRHITFYAAIVLRCRLYIRWCIYFSLLCYAITPLLLANDAATLRRYFADYFSADSLPYYYAAMLSYFASSLALWCHAIIFRQRVCYAIRHRLSPLIHMIHSAITRWYRFDCRRHHAGLLLRRHVSSLSLQMPFAIRCLSHAISLMLRHADAAFAAATLRYWCFSIIDAISPFSSLIRWCHFHFAVTRRHNMPRE